MREKELCMLKQVLEMSDSNFRKFQKGLISAVIIKGNKSEEKPIFLCRKSEFIKAMGFSCYLLLKSQIMNAEEFVLIPKRMFISKNPTKGEIFDNPIYQEKPLSYRSYKDLIQILGRAMDKNYKMLTQALID